ncbi:MAG TPA: DHA2 family efflux MFS transporter permease subunit [Caulobacteraceae bacterium]|nr:DHA2 family efflux MFS transporter permease subunit [Caulobacteraceae bacterium]
MASEADVANRVPITGALMLATLMNTLDSTIANVALPHMQGSLGAAQDQITWVLTSYIIATAIMTPLSGWLSLKIGRKPMFLVSIAAFTVASMACGVAQNLPEMVLFRLIQGIAGASMMPLSQTVMLDIFPMSQIPQVMSIWSAAVIMGPIFGPWIGGWITESLDWRWVFFINLPIGILSFLGIYMFMEGGGGGRQRPFDFLGFGALVTFVGAFQLMTDRGPSQDWFGSREIWTYAVIAAVGFWVFIVQTMTAEHPFFHRDLAKDRNYVICSSFGFFVSALLFSTTALLPTFMQNLLGYSALQSGEASMPRGVGSLMAFLFVPYLIRVIGARGVLLIGIPIACFALWQMSHFDLTMTSMPIMTTGIIQGFGVGLLFSPLNVLGYATLNPIHRTEGTIVNTMARSLGSSIGISMISAALTSQSSQAHASLANHVNCGDPIFGAALPGLMNPCAGDITAFNGEVTRQGAMIAYDTIFAWMALGVMLLLPLLMLMRPSVQAAVAPMEEMAAE